MAGVHINYPSGAAAVGIRGASFASLIFYSARAAYRLDGNRGSALAKSPAIRASGCNSRKLKWQLKMSNYLSVFRNELGRNKILAEYDLLIQSIGIPRWRGFVIRVLTIAAITWPQ